MHRLLVSEDFEHQHVLRRVEIHIGRQDRGLMPLGGIAPPYEGYQEE